MSIWKEIKKSINSDLNVPLNERLYNKEAIVSDDENIFASFSIPAHKSIEFKMLTDGSCAIKNVSTPTASQVTLYINNTQKAIISKNVVKYVNVFKRGDVFRMTNTTTNTSVVNILAVHKDLSGVKVI